MSSLPQQADAPAAVTDHSRAWIVILAGAALIGKPLVAVFLTPRRLQMTFTG